MTLAALIIMGRMGLAATLADTRQATLAHPDPKGVAVDPSDGYTNQEADQMLNYYAVVTARVLCIFALVGVGIILAVLVGMVVIVIVRKGWQLTDRIVSTGKAPPKECINDLS